MDNLTNYDDSGDEEPKIPCSESDNATAQKLSNLESEWENFEKMLAGGEDADAKPADEAAESVPESVPESLPGTSSGTMDAGASSAAVFNPYAYLSQFTANTDQGHAADMEKQLEAFLEHAANAASQATGDEGQEGQDDESHTDSEHSGTGSDAESDVSDRSPGAKDANDVKDAGGSAAGDPVSAKPLDTNAEDKLSNKGNRSPSRGGSQRRSGSQSRSSRSRRSHSTSRRSRSRSHSRRHRRKRSSSRSRHGGSRRRKRSGSRHRRHGRRSRSPRHRHSGSQHRGSRHRRRRSGSRERRRPTNRRARFANYPQMKAPVQEDFKTRMKRELQQAAKDALAGKVQATPQQALLQTMAAMHAKAQELTGVEIPKFYNPAAINPLKFAEQQQKRKLLWSKAGENKEQSLQKFQGTDVVADEKYRKLMGIKGDVSITEMSEEQKMKQNELFAKLDREYAFARLATHTHRGMGLGVVSSMAAASANDQFNKP